MDLILGIPPFVWVIFIVIIAVIVFFPKSGFKRTLITPPSEISNEQPKNFPPLTEPHQEINLLPPVVPEEIGLAMAYPQGSGVGMDPNDSNSFYPDTPGPLLTSHLQPISYGESNMADPYNNSGSAEGSRVLKIKSTGSQSSYQPVDNIIKSVYSPAYTAGEVSSTDSTFINGSTAIDYKQNFEPEQNLKLQASPGQKSTLPNCEGTYPNVVKYNGMCITEGDIPYGEVVDGKVNPRLVSRWESFTGDYSRQQALEPIDGVLYPNLNVMT
jgi:hypothetical protein